MKQKIDLSELLEVDSVVIFGDSEHWKSWNEKMIYDLEEDENA